MQIDLFNSPSTQTLLIFGSSYVLNTIINFEITIINYIYAQIIQLYMPIYLCMRDFPSNSIFPLSQTFQISGKSQIIKLLLNQ